jgi:hypothetical protein
MAATERTAEKPSPSHPRPLPPTPAAPKATAVAKEALKPAPRRVSSIYALAERKSCDLTWPTTPHELSKRVSDWVSKATIHPNDKEKYITNARELLDEILVQTLLYQEPEIQKLWMPHIELGYSTLDSFTKYHNMQVSDSRFVDFCKRIKEHQEPSKEKLATPDQPGISESPDLLPKSITWKTLKKIYLIATTILSLVGLFFTARICIQRFLVKK